VENNARNAELNDRLAVYTKYVRQATCAYSDMHFPLISRSCQTTVSSTFSGTLRVLDRTLFNFRLANQRLQIMNVERPRLSTFTLAEHSS